MPLHRHRQISIKKVYWIWELPKKKMQQLYKKMASKVDPRNSTSSTCSTRSMMGLSQIACLSAFLLSFLPSISQSSLPCCCLYLCTNELCCNKTVELCNRCRNFKCCPVGHKLGRFDRLGGYTRGDHHYRFFRFCWWRKSTRRLLSNSVYSRERERLE